MSKIQIENALAVKGMINIRETREFIKTKNPIKKDRVLMWYLQESNQGHTDFQSVALPTELRYLA